MKDTPTAVDLSSDTLEGIDSEKIKFGKYEVEEAVRGLLSFLRNRGSLLPFRLEELIDFYRDRELSTKFLLFGLICFWEDDGMGVEPVRQPVMDALITIPDGRLMITKEFLKRCREIQKN